MAAPTEKPTVYDVITDRICGALKRGVVPWRRPWGQPGMGASDPTNLVSGKPYQGINIFLLTLAPYASPYWLTFNQARRLRAHVRKGEKGTPIFLWRVYDRKTGAAAGADSEDSGRRFVGRYYTVFNAGQCDGLETPAVPGREEQPVPAAERIVKGYAGPAIRHGGAKAWYSPIGDVVQIPQEGAFVSAEAYYGTLFHELTHSTGHERRLKRFDNSQPLPPFGSPDYSREELVAEMGAAFLCARAGIDNHTIENSASYVANWLQVLGSDTRAVVYAASAARKAADLICGAPDEEQIDEAA